MKTKFLFLLTMLSILSLSCKNDDDTKDFSEGCVIQVPCEDPLGLISVAEADVLEEQYKSELYGRLNESMNAQYPGYEGAGRYIWFDLEEIKKYIVYIENHADQNGYENLGLRVYLGSKMQNNEDGNPEPRQTVFFVPTTNPTGGDDFSDNQNIVSAKRLNLGGAGIPDDVDQEIGVGP